MLYHVDKFSPDDLHGLIAHYAPHWTYAECDYEIALTYTRDVLNDRVMLPHRPNHPQLSYRLVTFTEWTHGRAFDENFEIRWEKEDAKNYAVAWLSETPPAEDFWLPANIPFDPNPVERKVLLIGNRPRHLSPAHALGDHQDDDKPVWIETRYSRPFYYPIEGGQHVYLQCKDYSINGAVVMTRLCSLVTE